MQAERGIRTRHQHDPRLCRQPSEEQLERRQRVGRLELVQVVDHQHDRPLERLQIRQQPFDDELAAQAGSRADSGHRRIAADRSASASIDGQPEPLPVALAALDRHPCRPIAEPGRLQPRADQHRLAAPRRAAHHGHAARRRGRQPLGTTGGRWTRPRPAADSMTWRRRRQLEHAAAARPCPHATSGARCAIRSEYVSPGAPSHAKRVMTAHPRPLVELAHGETTHGPDGSAFGGPRKQEHAPVARDAVVGRARRAAPRTSRRGSRVTAAGGGVRRAAGAEPRARLRDRAGRRAGSRCPTSRSSSSSWRPATSSRSARSRTRSTASSSAPCGTTRPARPSRCDVTLFKTQVPAFIDRAELTRLGHQPGRDRQRRGAERRAVVLG